MACYHLSSSRNGTRSNPEGVYRTRGYSNRINEDPLVVRLRLIAQRQPFEGYIGDLFAAVIGDVSFNLGRSLPKSPSHLSNQLRRMRPAMQQAGVVVELLGKDRKGQRVKVSVDSGQGEQPF